MWQLLPLRLRHALLGYYRRIEQAEIDALIAHVKKWSPVANTFTRPVNLEITL